MAFLYTYAFLPLFLHGVFLSAPMPVDEYASTFQSAERSFMTGVFELVTVLSATVVGQSLRVGCV